MPKRYDAVVVGSGPNGLAAALTLAEAGREVLVLEAQDTAGGGLRTEELVEPGFRHDVCSTVMALASLSPFLKRRQLELALPEVPLAHPLDDGGAVLVQRSVAATAGSLGPDERAYRRLIGPLTAQAEPLFQDLMKPIGLTPRHPVLMARFGLPALFPAFRLARLAFKGERARALFAGAAAHSLLGLDEAISASFGLVMLASAHATGWPVARGGSEAVAARLAEAFEARGGEIECGRLIENLTALPEHRAALFDVPSEALATIARERLPERYRARLARYRRGPGVFKLDWTLDAPIPWRAPECARAGTVHLGASLEEIALSEHEVAEDRHPEKPFVILVQPTLFDPSRAPAGKHVAWAYCHVPNGSLRDMTAAIEEQVERFAPGFKDVVRGRSQMNTKQLERIEPNCLGGDISGGRNDLAQLLARPRLGPAPYATPDPKLFLCSASTPPGGGIHGMCGMNAAELALKRVLR